MKSVILDENIPRRLGSRLPGHRVTTVPEQGWDGVKNGRLMALIDGSYDVFITADKNLRYQQNLEGRKISIIEVPFNDSVKLLPLGLPFFSRSKNPYRAPTLRLSRLLPANDGGVRQKRQSCCDA